MPVPPNQGDPLKHLLDIETDAAAQLPESGRRQVAIALEWDGKDSTAPRITASGQGELAEAILSLAFEQGVKVRKDADLAQLLSIVEVGQDIPAETFVAVAEILSYIYELNASLDPRNSMTNGETSDE